MTICIWNHGHPLKTNDPIAADHQKWMPITIDEFFDDVEYTRRQTILDVIQRVEEMQPSDTPGNSHLTL